MKKIVCYMDNDNTVYSGPDKLGYLGVISDTPEFYEPPKPLRKPELNTLLQLKEAGYHPDEIESLFKEGMI